MQFLPWQVALPSSCGSGRRGIVVLLLLCSIPRGCCRLPRCVRILLALLMLQVHPGGEFRGLLWGSRGCAQLFPCPFCFAASLRGCECSPETSPVDFLSPCSTWGVTPCLGGWHIPTHMHLGFTAGEVWGIWGNLGVFLVLLSPVQGCWGGEQSPCPGTAGCAGVGGLCAGGPPCHPQVPAGCRRPRRFPGNSDGIPSTSSRVPLHPAMSSAVARATQHPQPCGRCGEHPAQPPQRGARGKG